MKRMTFAIAGLFFFSLAIAQPQYDFAELQKEHQGENAVIIKNNTTYEIGLKKGKPAITSTRVFSYTILQDRTRMGGTYEVNYVPGFYEIKDIKAASYSPEEDGKYDRHKVKDFEDYSDLSGYIFYDDSRHRRFYFPKMGKGSYAEVEYTYEYLKPQFLGAHFFQPSSLAVKESVLTIVVDKDIEVEFSSFGDSSGITYTRTESRKEVIHTWTKNNAPAQKYFSDAPPARYWDPHIYVRVKSYTHKGKTRSMLGNVNDLYAFNYDFIKDVNTDPVSPDIQEVVDSLKKVNDNPDSLIRNIFYWVQDNIKYIAIEDGLGGYVPRQANDIFDNKYGDCKDKSSIITSMLRAAEIPSYLCWIGSRDLPYRYGELPTPNVDNHMIAAVYRQGKWIFLDGTASQLQYGYPTNFIQGKEALIAINKDSFAVVRVPIIPAEENRYTDTLYMRIEEDVLKCSGNMEARGMQKIESTELMVRLKEEEREKLLENMQRKGNNKCKVDSMEVFNLLDREKPLLVDYSITIPDYVTRIENNLYVNFWLSKTYASARIDTAGRGRIPKEVDYAYQDRHHYELIVPEGYRLKENKLPDAVNFHKGAISLKYGYTMVDNRIVLDYTFTVDTLIIEADQFADWNEVIDLLLKAYSEVIVLEKE